jgi:dihydrofolate synthase/folylpolyglutamate synthase
MLTAMAFLHFKGVGADVQVLEVGLGGRLDSTNVAQPRVCAITSISLDHVKTLGNSLALIAYEKAGIIKQGVPVVVAPQPEEAMEVIDRVARDRGAPLIEVEERMSWRKHRGGTDGQSFHVSGLRDSYDLWTPLAGDHQLENAAVAVATVETLAEAGTPVAKESIARGMEAVSWPGRLEIVSEGRPPVMVDGAHNPHSMRRLTAAVEDYFQFKRLFVIFGALGGHSAMGMISELASLAPRMLAVSSRHPRAASSEMLAEAVVTQGLELVFQSGDIGAATRRALEMADEDDLVLGTGSLSVAAEIIEEVRGIEPELYPSIKPPSRAGRSKV